MGAHVTVSAHLLTWFASSARPGAALGAWTSRLGRRLRASSEPDAPPTDCLLIVHKLEFECDQTKQRCCKYGGSLSASHHAHQRAHNKFTLPQNRRAVLAELM
jgi:hypothetical protein